MNSNLVKISELLSDHQYHDGTTIGHRLKITRAAVWKTIKKLESYGIELQSVKGKGYMLDSPLILLSNKKIEAALTHYSPDIEILEKTESTNDYLKELSKDQKKQPKVCIAEMQLRGKGRLNRRWHSPFGQNIYLSLLYRLQRDISELSGLSLVVGLAICQAIESVLPALKGQLSVKWPNDIIVNQLKIAGTLIEIQAESNGFCQAIIGVGMNVNMKEASKKQIDQQWSSLGKLTGNYIDRNILCGQLIYFLLEYLKRFSEEGFNEFLVEWRSRDYLLKKPIEIISSGVKYQGYGAGINSQGHLLVEMTNQTIQAFSSGDTTLVK